MAQRTPKDPSLCEFIGCNHKAAWLAHKLWGKGGTLRTCDAHKPGGDPRAVAGRAFYRVEPIAKTEE
jgi:hypothetical protein